MEQAATDKSTFLRIQRKQKEFPEIVQAAIRYINNQRGKVGDLATIERVIEAENGFHNLFRQTVGLSTSQYAVAYNARKALEELSGSDMSDGLIARRWGFHGRKDLYEAIGRYEGLRRDEIARLDTSNFFCNLGPLRQREDLRNTFVKFKY
ncbi:hypothetical protein HYT58_02725 [Candidatus Woesearchaeota archaeon]|nr:hypothetical protein [Candidatus Woesearchaeota archaeon]